MPTGDFVKGKMLTTFSFTSERNSPFQLNVGKIPYYMLSILGGPKRLSKSKFKLSGLTSDLRAKAAQAVSPSLAPLNFPGSGLIIP